MTITKIAIEIPITEKSVIKIPAKSFTFNVLLRNVRQKVWFLFANSTDLHDLHFFSPKDDVTVFSVHFAQLQQHSLGPSIL